MKSNMFSIGLIFGLIAVSSAMAQVPSGSDRMERFTPRLPEIRPGNPLVPPAARPASGRYRVVVTGFTAHHETWDHSLEVDGKRDEIFVKSEVYELKNGNLVFPKVSPRSYTFGDVFRSTDLNRKRVGTASGLGGIMTGDSYPVPPSPREGCSTDPDRSDPPGLPMELWAGELVQGQNAVTIIPTIWEYDGGQDAYDEWIKWAKKTTTKLSENKAFTNLTGSTGATIMNLTNLGLDIALSLSEDDIFGQAKDRPIGMTLREGTDKTYDFSPQVLRLTYETVEAALTGESRFGGYQAGVLPLTYTDDAIFAGDYTLFIKIERDGPIPPRSVWSACSVGMFQTADGDVLEYRIEGGVVPPDTVEFALALGPNVTWLKQLNMPDGQGSSWNIRAEGSGLTATASNTLWASQVHNGQKLTFAKAKAFGALTNVLQLGDLQGLKPGSRITFTWMKD